MPMGWTTRALQYLTARWPRPAITTEAEPGAETPVVVYRWSCGDGGVIARRTAEGDFALTATCTHLLHHELGQYPLVQVNDVALLDPAGKEVDGLPFDASGFRLRFTVGNVVFQHPPLIVVRSQPDLTSNDDNIAPSERWNAGIYSLGEQYEIELAGMAKHERELNVQLVEPETARLQRWTVPGVVVWRKRVAVR